MEAEPTMRTRCPSTSLMREPTRRVALSVRGLSISVGDKTLLDDVSLDLPSGKLLAIMGGSGSGKTTLLNALLQRVNITNKALSFSGRVHYMTTGKVSHAYLLQTDVFLEGLSVYETLYTQAQLRTNKDKKKEKNEINQHSLHNTTTNTTDIDHHLAVNVSHATRDTIPHVNRSRDENYARDQQSDDYTPPATNRADSIDELVCALLQALDIAHVRDASPFTLSGGEQRRVLLAIQLLSRPALLFLDEPTTGLDTASALKLVSVLRRLCSGGLTVVLSIHQPRIEVTRMFDRLCVLTRGGRVVYYGAVDAPYFTQFGSLEGFMRAAVRDATTKEREEQSGEEIERLVEAWRNQALTQDTHVTDDHATDDDLSHFQHNLALFEPHCALVWTQIWVLTLRTFTITRRDVWSLLAFIGGMILLALAIGLIFLKPGSDLAGIRLTTSVLFAVLEVIGFCPMMFDLERLWLRDGIYFAREYSEGIVTPIAFLVLRRLGKLILEDIPVSFAFASITYFMWGLRMYDAQGEYDATYFGTYLGIIVLVYMVGMSSSVMIYAILKDFNVLSLILNCFYQLQNLACGYFVNARTMPVYVRWTKYIAYFWYGFGALTANQYHDWMGDCPYDDVAQCTAYSGEEQLRVLGFPSDWIAEPAGILVAWFFGFYALAVVGLHLKNYDLAVGAQKKNRIGGDEQDHNEGGEEKGVLEDRMPALDLTITNVALSARSGIEITGGIPKMKRKPILRGVSATFAGGKVNVIMGPLGSGKTTLLNYLAGRGKGVKQDKSMMESFPENSGDMEKTNEDSNNRLRSSNSRNSHISPIMVSSLGTPQPTTISQLRNIAGYVTQHDNALLAKLTVRETLYYQARLRLPASQHPRIPHIVARLIRQVGLVDCADTIVGNENIKGISGGEKRRVSIAIQLLLRPKILFLDEPTSGLDSTTSAHIVALLAELAAENGLTVIMTIHQPHDAIFAQFERVLLLARGRTVYDGRARDVSMYLANAGLPVPPTVAIADHVVDVMVRGEEEDEEEVSERVEGLIKRWESGKGIQMGDKIKKEEIQMGEKIKEEEIQSGSSSEGKEKLQKLENLEIKTLDDERITDEKKSPLDGECPDIDTSLSPGTSSTTSSMSKWPFPSPPDISIFSFHRLPFHITFPAVSSRQCLNIIRSKDVIISRAGQTIFLTIVHTLFFAPLRNGSEGVSNRLGLVQEVLNLYFVGLVNNVSIYPQERDLFYQETEDDVYGVATFSLSYLVNELPTEVIPSLFFLAMIVFVCGLPRTPGMFFLMVLTTIGAINAGESLGIMVNSAFLHLGVATNVLMNSVSLAIFMGGTMSVNMPGFFRALNYLLPMKYAVGICAQMALRGQTFDCGEGCELNTGEKVLDYYHMSENLGGMFGGMVAVIVIYRILAVILVWLRVRR